MGYHSRKAISILEIIIAVTVLAIALIPLSGMISRQTAETDESQTFALDKATEVLNTLLDNVTFHSLREGNPGYIRVDDLPNNDKYEKFNDSWAKRTAKLLFNHVIHDSHGYACRGVFKDSKGINYLIHLRIENIYSFKKLSKPDRLRIGTSYPEGSPNDFEDLSEIGFSYLKNPSFLTSTSWSQEYAETPNDNSKALTELEMGNNGISEPKKNLYLDEGLSEDSSEVKFSFLNPTAERFTAKMAVDEVPYKADKDFGWVPFKRLIVQVQWNSDKNYYQEPENEKGNIQRIHLMAIKGDLN